MKHNIIIIPKRISENYMTVEFKCTCGKEFEWYLDGREHIIRKAIEDEQRKD